MELWDAYDRRGQKTGATLIRGEPIPAGLYHLVCEVVVRHADGDFLLLQRDSAKEAYPGWWEIGAGGSALQGEDPDGGARRELWEESGIEASVLRPLYQVIDDRTGSIYHGYCCVTDCDKSSVRLQAGETAAFRWISREEFLLFYDSDGCIPSQKPRLSGLIALLRQE